MNDVALRNNSDSYLYSFPQIATRIAGLPARSERREGDRAGVGNEDSIHSHTSEEEREIWGGGRGDPHDRGL